MTSYDELSRHRAVAWLRGDSALRDCFFGLFDGARSTGTLTKSGKLLIGNAACEYDWQRTWGRLVKLDLVTYNITRGERKVFHWTVTSLGLAVRQDYLAGLGRQAADPIAYRRNDRRVNRMQVWVLIITHKHGCDTSVHADEAGARATLYGYVEGWWLREIGEAMPPSPSEAIERYFQEMSAHESYTLEHLPVQQ